MAIDKKKFRREWLGGLGQHVGGAAIGARLKAKHAPKAATDEALEPDAPMAHADGGTGAPPMAHAEPDGDEMGGSACPHCGSPMEAKAKPAHKAPMKHGLDADSLALLLRSH